MTASKFEPASQPIYTNILNLLNLCEPEFPAQKEIEQSTGKSWSDLVKDLGIGSGFKHLSAAEKRALVFEKATERLKNYNDLNNIIDKNSNTSVVFTQTLDESIDPFAEDIAANVSELDDFGNSLLNQLTTGQFKNFADTKTILTVRQEIDKTYKSGYVVQFVSNLGDLIANEGLMLLKELLFQVITQVYDKHPNILLNGTNKSDQYDATTVAQALAPVEQELKTLDDFSKRLPKELSQYVAQLIQRLGKDIDQVKKYPQAFRHFETLFIARLHTLNPIFSKEPAWKTIVINFIATLFNAGLILVGKLLPNKVCYGECYFFNHKSKTQEHLKNIENAYPKQLAS